MRPTLPGTLRRQVPLLIALVLFVGVLSFGAVAYRAVRASSLQASVARLDNVARQFSGLFQTSFSAIADSTRAVASDEAVVSWVARDGELSAARAALDRLRVAGDGVRVAEVRGPDGRVLMSSGDTAGLVREREGSGRGGISGLFLFRDTVSFEARAPVGPPSRPLGWVTQLRVITSSAASVDQLNRLIGNEAALFVGNADGSLWTDFRGVASRPPPSERGSAYARAGERRRSLSRAIEGTPLYVAIELPEAGVLAATRPLIATFAGLGLLVIAFGTAVGWVISGRITAPLARLAGAAEVVASGQTDHVKMAADRNDEVGRLTRAFNRMAQKVTEAHGGLERQVEARTAELEAAQEELVRKERLATLGQLSSGVGHELRNPLGVMTNAIYYLQHTLPDASPKVVEYLGILSTQIRLSEKIVGDLLDFARIKDPQRASVQVDELIEEQLDRVDVPESVRVVRGVTPEAGCVHVDRVQVGQVLLNLFTNAVQAMAPEGGTLSVAAAAHDGVVRVTVVDTGPGVSLENRDMIFEPLFTTKARGIGLGLSVSRALARANGGDLVLDEPDGGGATFYMDLPRGAGA